MVSLTFVFNEERVAAAGKTVDELLQPMRDWAAQKGIQETSYGVFEMDGNRAMCLVGSFIVDITNSDYKYVTYLDEWIFDVDGEEEDCIKETYEWYQEKHIDVGYEIPVVA